MKMKRITLGVFLLFVASAASAQVTDVSLCDVLAKPAAYDGKVVRIKGATAIAGFDEFVIDGSACTPAGALWLAYPEGTKGKAGPAATLRLQLANNAAGSGDAAKPAAVTLVNNGDFARFDSLLAAPYKSRALCLGCPRNTVSATVTGRVDAVSQPGVVRDANGSVTAINGFGNLNLYPARLVLQSVSDVVAHEIDYGTTTIRGDSRKAQHATAEGLQRAAAAYGAEGEDNGVIVTFGVANEVVPDERAKGSSASPDEVLYYVMFDMNRLGKDRLSNAMAHIGTHIADLRSSSAPRSAREAEEHAWQTTFH